MQIDAEFLCAWCGEPNPTTVDASAGARQAYTEDCQVCCRPNRLTVTLSADGDEAWIDADQE
ncbi:MAG TPA: CPXCG motif-containing cysteine-rich protein [Candidatus Sumerlaeota bacterium]|nr:CPXCG motif-containing cysteine-rich protein [Candidatus Sumerlaeota bacterium]HPK00897.1 CPXCG motif-containing cysteine-rich protein [Candidatus Sumerlaeota bacterium]